MNKLIIKIIALLFFIFSYFLISTSQINAQSTGQGKNLNIPYTSQENRPDCWAACIIMIAEAVVPRIDNNLMRIVFETGNTDGIRLDNLESNTTLLGYIQRRANNAQLIVRTFYDNEIYIPTSNYILLPIEIKNLLSHIRQQIDAGRPVMFCSTSKMASSEQTGPVSGHCITIVGYKDDKHYYIHDPKGRNSVDVNNLVDISYFLKNLSENTVYVTISIASPLAGDRHMLQTYLDYDAFIFERLSTATVKGDKIFYRKSFNNNNLFEWADGTGKVYQTIPELFDNLTTTGLSIKIYNASNSDQCVTALYEIGRRDNSVVLPVVSNYITAGPKSVNSFNGAAPIDINISLLRDRTNPVDCYMKLTLQDGNKRTFHEEEFDFTLDPSIQCFTLIPKFIDCNKFNFRVESVQPFPLKIQYEYEIKHQNSTFIDNFTTDQNPVEYIFTKGGKYNIRVQVTNSSSTSGKNKRVIVGEAETTVDITNPPVIIRTRPTSDEMEYELEAESCLSKPDRAWYVSEGNNPKTKLSDDSVIIRHKFPKEGSYRVYVELNDTNTKKLIAEGSVVVNVKKTKSTDEIDEAFKNKNWKKLIDLHRRANTDDEKKLIYDYLKKLADEFNDQNKKILQDLKNLKTKNDTNFNSYYTKASAQLSSLKGEEARKLSECMDNTKEKYEREKLQIEKAISYFEYTESFYNNMDVNNLGEFFFDGNDKKQLSVPYDLNKPFPEVNYETFCADTKAVEEIKKVRVSLRATNKNPKPGEIVKIEAIIERPQNSIGCPEEEYFKWTGENIALSNNEMGIPDSSASFIASKAGSYPVGVTASCMGKDFGTDSITITVQGGMTGEIKDLDSEVYFGSSKDIRLDTSLDALSQASGNTQVTEACLKQQQEYEEQKRAYEECQAANAGKSEEMQVVCRPPLPPEFDDCAGKTEGSYSVLWQASEEGIKFLPKEGSNGNTTITFTRMSDNLQVWAEVRQFNNGQLETIGRVDNSQVKVLPPEFTIEFDPNSNKAKIGETVTAQLNSNPFVDPSIIDYRWVEPTDRKEISNGKIEFVPKDNKPIKFHVIARVPHYGDTINDAIKDEFTPGEYEVVAKLVGPKFDKNFPNWSEKDKGLTYKPIKLVTGQQIVASATTKDIEPEKVNYEWKSNEGCHIDAGQYSNEVTVSRSEAGSCDLTVTAYDKDKRRLGEGTLSFNVAEQDGGSGISTGDKDKDKDADKDKADQAKKDANEKFEKAKEEISKGNLDEAITILDEATKLDPENTQIKDTLNNTKEEKKQITTHVDKANQLISEGKFDEAEKEIDEAKKINSNYKTITETVTKIKTAKSQYAEKLFNEATQLVSSGKLNEAIIKLDEAVKIDPANKKITDYKDKISSEKAFIDKTARSFNLNISGANYGEAEKDLESMDALHPNYEPVVVAKAIWNSRLPERMGEVTGALQQAKELVTQGKLDEAIQMLEEALVKAQKIKEASHLATQVSEYLNKLKAERTTVLDQITKAKQFIAQNNFNDADKELASARQLHGNYQPVKDATAFYDAEKKKYADNSDLVNGKIQKAKWLVEEGKLDEAITWAEEAVSLDPNNTYATNYANQLKAERKTCLEQVEKVKTYVKQNNVESAKKELQVATNLHPKYLPVVQAAELIGSIEESNTNVVKEKITEASIALTNKEYKKVLSIVDDVRSNYKLNQQDLSTIINIESAAKKALADKDQAIVCLKAGENQYNQHDYLGAISNFEMGLGKYSHVWEPTDTEPEHYSKLLSSAKKKQARIDQLMNEITNVVQNNNADIDTVKKALTDTQEVLYLQPGNNQAESYKNILTDRLNKLASKQNTIQNTTYNNNQQNQINTSGSQTRTFNLTNNTRLTINIPNAWNVEVESDGAVSFYNKNVPVMISIVNFASSYNNNYEKDRFINDHKNQMKGNRDLFSFQDKNSYLSGINVLMLGFSEKAGPETIYNDCYYPYNKRKLFEVVASSRNNPANGQQEKSELLQNIMNAILQEDSGYNNIASNQNNNQTQNQHIPVEVNKDLLKVYLDSKSKSDNNISTSNDNKNTMVGNIDDALNTVQTNKNNFNVTRVGSSSSNNSNSQQSNQTFDTDMSGTGKGGSLSDHIKTISTATNNQSGNNTKSTSTGSTSSSGGGSKIIDIGNLGGCSYTDKSVFRLNSTTFLSRLEIWYSWDQGEQSVSYNLYDGNNSAVKSGSFVRGSCDPNQRQWCQGITDVRMNLNPSNYTLKLGKAKLCQNSQSGGNGFIKVYADSVSGSGTQIATNTTNKTNTGSNTVKTSGQNNVTKTITTSNTAGPQSVKLVIFNENSNSIHFFTDGESFGPGNKVAPGASRAIQLNISPGKSYTIYAGRNGQVLARIAILYGNLKDYSQVHIKFNDSQELLIHEKFQRF